VGVVVFAIVGGILFSKAWNVGLRLSLSAETRCGIASGIAALGHCCRAEHASSVHSLSFFVPKDLQNVAFKTPVAHLRDLHFDCSVSSCGFDVVDRAALGVAGCV
jgi:hypothetical protein